MLQFSLEIFLDNLQWPASDNKSFSINVKWHCENYFLSSNFLKIITKSLAVIIIAVPAVFY